MSKKAAVRRLFVVLIVYGSLRFVSCWPESAERGGKLFPDCNTSADYSPLSGHLLGNGLCRGTACARHAPRKSPLLLLLLFLSVCVFSWVGYGLVLKKQVDETKPENKKTQDYAKRKARSLPEFSKDAASIEAEARRVASDAASMENATRKGWVVFHGQILLFGPHSLTKASNAPLVSASQ
jgi:hypothetical protein